ncbi:MAG TPA: hypothetical protein VK957_10460, partial [Lunatimonas sp.]|nr:hypothetical protein [Lunatimonas sp.]
MSIQLNRFYLGCAMLIVCYFPLPTYGQTTEIVILNKHETEKLRELLAENAAVRAMYDSIGVLADNGLTFNANPQPYLSYEGMLPT